MSELSSQEYTDNFNRIFDWFHDNVHAAPEEFEYQINDLDRTHLKLVDIVRKTTGGLYFRVILKATYDDVEQAEIPEKNYKDLGFLFNTKTKNDFIPATATQICYLQLNKENLPINGILYTYSPDDQKYHPFKL